MSMMNRPTGNADRELFPPVSKENMLSRGWYYYDFLLVTGDAYVDHPSFGIAVIARVLESAGYRVAVLAQPSFKNPGDFLAFGKPRYAVMITGGNIDSMVAHYTASKKKRSGDAYSPGGKAGLRPDRAATVYARLSREAFPETPVALGGLECSLRRFAHYDYWGDGVMPSALVSAGADILMYGMGERTVLEVAGRFKSGAELSGIPGTCALLEGYPEGAALCPSFEEVRSDKTAYARAEKIQMDEQDPIRGRAVAQKHGDLYLVQHKPAMPLGTAELDVAAELPYTRRAHPDYDSLGGVPALDEVEFSIIHNRGCFGSCSFCSLTFHQGRIVTSRSHASVLREAEIITKLPGFKGYIHDVGGPTANFRAPACKKQMKRGTCKNRACLTPVPCESLTASHADYLALLRKLRALDGVKKVFVRSGVRFDYLLADKDGAFFSELVEHHVSGQLKVAPEHIAPETLYYMNKPPVEVYEKFRARFERLNKKHGKNQFLVPYLISSHPGTTLRDAVRLSEYLNANRYMPEQVQDFYPTPGTLSTCMYYTGIDPRTMEPVHVVRTPREKAMQRALLQWRKPSNRALVLEALRLAGREDLIGFSKGCLVRGYAAKPSQFGREAGAGRGGSGSSGRGGARKESRASGGKKRR